MAIAGRVAIVPKGDWSADATYKRLDAVTYNNTLYFAKKEVPAGTATSNTEYWSKSIVGGAGAIATKDDAGIIKAVSTGDTSVLSKNARNLFTSAGIAHILAISGLHIAIVAGAIIALLEMLGINKRKSSLIAVIMLGFYTVFTGGNTAVLRSFIMTAVVLMGRVFYRRGDALNSCSIAGIVILLLNPYSLFSIGFQLSFVSVAALITIADFMEQSDNVVEKLKGGIIASLFVSVVTFPIISYNFYIVTLYGFITNNTTSTAQN